MAKIYLRRVKGGDCGGCHITGTGYCIKSFNINGKHFICSIDDISYKKISERTAKKLIKEGKCKIVNNPSK